MASPPLQAGLERIEDLTPTVRGFHFVVEGLDRFDFKPGQWVSLHFPMDGKPHTRDYSIASPPKGDSRFELCVKHVPGGPATRYLWGLRPGDRVQISGPHGGFLLREPIDSDLVFVATGTGVAPFRPMLNRALPRSDGRRVTLLFGARRQGDILYAPEWEALERAYPNFRFVPTLSRPDPGWTGRKGYVQDATAGLLEGRTDVDVYICGLSGMVSTVRQQCEAWGYPGERVHYENYDD